MNKFTHFKSFNPLFTFILFVAVALMSACGGDDEPDPEPIDCSTLALTATAERTTITAVATGGEAPYNFRLDEGTAQSSGTFTVEEFGSYEVTVTDANECEKKTTVQVVDPCANFSVSATASAYDLTIAINDGTPPFSYSYSNGNEEITADDINERSFTVELAVAEETTITITDANDCTAEATVEAEDIASFEDQDGQIYNVVKIGDQIWFAENYNKETEEGSYCYDNEESNCETYGKLYTWDEATSEGFAPTGWSLPSEADFESLNTFLGANAGTQLKVGGSSGFEAKLSGVRIESSGNFVELGINGFFWSNSESESNTGEAYVYYVTSSSNQISSNDTEKTNAVSIRFLKN